MSAGATAKVLMEVAAERRRQDELFPDQHLPNGTTEWLAYGADQAKAGVEEAAKGGFLTWSLILNEEFREACAETDDVKLRAELVQVAAVAVRWIEDIDSRQAS